MGIEVGRQVKRLQDAEVERNGTGQSMITCHRLYTFIFSVH